MRMPEVPGVFPKKWGKLASRFCFLFFFFGGEGEKRNFESSWMKRFFCWFGPFWRKAKIRQYVVLG